MSDRFTEALRYLGHIYEPRPADAEIKHSIRHIEKCYLPTGDVKPICGAEGQGLACPNLYPDANCEQCREIEGVPVAITKRSLMLDLVNTMCDIEQQFLDAMYWNYHNRDEEPINPDPDGELAKAWTDYKIQIMSMMSRFELTMTKHEGRFGWPAELCD
jgi:hypothetical protein